MSDNFPSKRRTAGDALDELRRKLAEVSLEEAGASADSGLDDASTSSIPPQIRRLGDYELIDKLGEGGMGTVYLARQHSLADRRIALKILPPYFALDPRRVARFRNEAMTAAKVDHPGIVTIIEIGEQDGVHFLVQELVPGGRTLAHWIDERRRAPVQPKGHYTTVAVLFAKVANALQAVHAKHVIHRDIKPSNILLMPDDQPKVADFGLARDSEGVGLSSSGESPGTPSYKSPEQIDRRIGAVDAQSDVFSLGATLYEALTLRRLFDGDSDHEIYAKICGDEVDDPRVVRAGVPAALALICRKALEKEPRRRYGSMAEFADDLGRYVANKPIRAHPPSSARRVQLWAKRNVIAAGLSIASVIVLATAATAVWIVVGKNQELKRSNTQLAVQTKVAEDKEAQALASGRRARKVTEFVQNALIRSDPNQGGAQGFLVADAMAEAVHDLDNGALKGDPETEASLEMTIASILDGNGRSDDALRLAQAALESRRQRLSGDHQDLALNLNLVGTCLRSLGRPVEALEKFEQAMVILERAHAGDHADIAMALNNIATCLRILGRDDEALPKLQAALEMFERLHPDGHADVALAWNNLGECLSSLGQVGAALQANESSLAMSQRLDSRDRPEVAAAHSNIGVSFLSFGANDQALTEFQAASDMSKRLFPSDNPVVAKYSNNVAACLKALGWKVEALTEYEAGLAMRRRLYADDHPDTAASLNNVASCLKDLGLSAEALPKFEAALAMRQRVFPCDHVEVADSLNNVGICLESLNRWAEALARHQAALAMRQRLFLGDHLKVAASFDSASRCLWRLGKRADALPMCQAALEMRERLVQGDDPEVAVFLNNFAACLNAVGRSDDALPYAERAVAMANNVFPADDPRLADSIETLAHVRQRRSKPEAPDDKR